MQTVLSRQLGRSGIPVSAMGLGCWAIGGPFWGADSSPSGWGQVDDNESIRAIQFETNVLLEAAPLVALCEELNLAAIDRGPLAMGVLTGKFTADMQLPADDVRGVRVIDENGFFSDGRANPKLLKQLEAIREILTSKDRTLAQGALAWLWARSEKHIPIPGFKTVAQVEDDCGALDKGPLSADQMREIETLLGR
jgi:aryl-alcohol dehydrogenase-like predicted oxidoreductase